MNTPSIFKPVKKAKVCETCFSGPFCNAKPLSIVFNVSVLLFILCLLSGCRPSNIVSPTDGDAFFATATNVASSIFDSVNRVLWRGLESHCSVESLGRFKPWTNENTNRSVLRILPIVLVVASPNHRPPAIILRGVAHPVNSFCLGDLLVGTRPTAFSHPIPEMGSGCNMCFSAITAAIPNCASTLICPSPAENCQPPEFFSDCVFDVRVKDCTIIFSFDHIQGMVEVRAQRLNQQLLRSSFLQGVAA